MKTLETTDIPVGIINPPGDVDRNPEFTELVESIKERGLLNPLTVHAVNGETNAYNIIAGKRRYWACMSLEFQSIPARIFIGTDQELQLATIEENLRRENLPWWDVAKLIANWHTTRQGEHGKAAPLRGKEKREQPGWSMRDTADELKLSLGFISEALLLDREVEKDPTLRKIKDRSTAVRLVRSKAKQLEALEMAEMPVEFAVNQVYNGSSVDVLKRFPDGCFTACITDPPWLRYVDEKLTRDDETVPVFKEVYRVLAPDSFLYLFVGFDDLRSYSRKLPEYGFKVAKTPALWVKHGIQDNKLHGMVLSQGVRAWEYSRDFELILVAVKGSPSLVNSVQKSSIFVHPPVQPTKLVHPNEKPLSLIEEILNDCTNQGALVLDPFAGSGAHIAAAQKAGRRFIGIERDREFYVNITRRIKTNE